MRSEIRDKIINYVAKVEEFYATNDVKEGVLEFDNTHNRFLIKDEKGNFVQHLNCGDIFIVNVRDDEWYIGQCERHVLWCMIGTGLSEDMAHSHEIIYHPTTKLRREHVGDIWFNANDIIGPLTEDTMAVIKKRITHIRDDIQVGDIVHHFKRETLSIPGNLYLYKILAFAEHTETKETLVIYQALYKDPSKNINYTIFARPMDMFMSEVERDKYPNIKQRYRFEKYEGEIRDEQGKLVFF